VFKTAADPYVGRLTYFKVFSGAFKADSHAWNANKNADERVGPVYRITGKTQDPVPQVVAGDIGAVAKLAETQTGDSLCAKEAAVTLPAISFPNPSYSVAVTPKTKADLDKMGTALQRIVEEDPSLRLERNPATGEMIIAGLGDAHVDVAMEKIHRKFGVDWCCTCRACRTGVDRSKARRSTRTRSRPAATGSSPGGDRGGAAAAGFRRRIRRQDRGWNGAETVHRIG
jgi:elongation factor G